MILFCGGGLKCFSSPRGTNCKTTHYLLLIFFRFSALNGTAKAPAADLLMLDTLEKYQNRFLTPKRYYEQSCYVYLRVPSDHRAVYRTVLVKFQHATVTPATFTFTLGVFPYIGYIGICGPKG